MPTMSGTRRSSIFTGEGLEPENELDVLHAADLVAPVVEAVAEGVERRELQHHAGVAGVAVGATEVDLVAVLDPLEGGADDGDAVEVGSEAVDHGFEVLYLVTSVIIFATFNFTRKHGIATLNKCVYSFRKIDFSARTWFLSAQNIKYFRRQYICSVCGEVRWRTVWIWFFNDSGHHVIVYGDIPTRHIDI